MSDRSVECWTPMLWAGDASPASLVEQAVRYEAEGWDGVTCPDTQCIMPETFVMLTMVAMRTRHLKMGTGVTVPLTRHPAVTASAIAAVQSISGGRAVLGVGRGDTALAYLGCSPVRLATFESFVTMTRRYLAGESIPLDEAAPRCEGAIPGFDTLAVGHVPEGSKLAWLDPDMPSVPVEVTATGPKALAMAGRCGDRVALNVGVDPGRVAWAIAQVRAAARDAGRDPHAIGISLYASVVPTDSDGERERDLVRPFVMGSSRFTVMDREVRGFVTDHQREVLERTVVDYDITEHVRQGQKRGAVDDAFIDSYAIIGSSEHCLERLADLVALGVDRFMITYSTPDREDFDATRQRLVSRVLPMVHQM